MDKQSKLSNLKELLSDLKKSDYDKEQSINYLRSLIEDLILKPETQHDEIITSRLARAKQNDFRFASGFFGRWAEHSAKSKEQK